MILCIVLCLLAIVSARVPLHGQDNTERIEGQFLVIYHQNITTEQAVQHTRTVSRHGTILFTYNIGDTFKGFAAKLDDKILNLLLGADEIVNEVHYDGIVRSLANSCGSSQENAASWGLARTSQKGSILGGINADYYYDSGADGKGVKAYILDTGIYIEHSDFEGRALHGANFADSVATDENGHGTHGACTVGGKLYGLAKDVSLVAVKVLGATGSGTFSSIIAGIQYVTQQHELGGPSVATMALGSSTDGGINAAIKASVQKGVVYVVSAGGSNANACNFYPASSPDVICVSATGTSDQRTSSSNYGPCVTVFAPGSSIRSCGISSPTSSVVYSGTSMACNHVTGIVATLLQKSPTASPATIKSQLVSIAQSNLISDVGPGSPNKILYNMCDEA